MDLGIDDVKRYFEGLTNLIENFSEKNLIWILGGSAFFIFVLIFLVLKMFV